jgi:hypothetical protein
MMTRKDYVEVAKILKDIDVDDSTLNRFIQMFKSDNPRFDSNRFLTAVKGN